MKKNVKHISVNTVCKSYFPTTQNMHNIVCFTYIISEPTVLHAALIIITLPVEESLC